MIYNFDSFQRNIKPEFILCNPDGSQLSALHVYDTSCTLRYNDTSEISFTMDSAANADYELVTTNRQILIPKLGYFIIDSVSDSVTNKQVGVEYVGQKTVNAKSCQYEMSFKIVDYLNGTYKFYDSTGNFDENGEPTTFMGYVMSLAPGWTIDSVDAALESRYRTLDISGQTLLDVLYSVAEEQYQCIFTFDFLNRKIKVDAISSLLETDTNKTQIYLSFDNLVKSIEVNEDADDIKTKIFVSGQDIDIREVNPIGTNYILNLSFWANTEWMSSDLVTKVNAYDTLVESKRTEYANLATTLRGKRVELTTLQSELKTLEGQKAEQDNLMSVRIEGGYDYSEILAAISNYITQIANKKAEIEAKQAEIDTVLGSMKAINSACAMKNNFTEDELKVLSAFIREGSYSNNSYIVTDEMTAEQIQDMKQDLYDEAKIVAGRLSQPSFTFNVDADAFIHIPEFEAFTKDLNLGCMVTVERAEDFWYYPILLEMTFSYDDLEDFSLSFGNRFRLDDAGFTYEEMISSANSTSGQVNANWNSIVDFSRNYKSEITKLITDAFNVAAKSIISAADQNIVWDSSGMTFRRSSDGGATYENEQFKIINNLLAFTDDGWNTIKTAIGKITLDGGGTKYGIVAEAVIGKLLAGENLVITNENQTFRMDENGLSFVVKDAGGNEENVAIGEYIQKLVDEVSVEISGQYDGKIDSFYQSTMPYSEVTGITEASAEYEDCVKREGDIWFNTAEESSYRYTRVTSGGAMSFLWKSIDGVPSGIWDSIDGKKTIYTTAPIGGFKKDDIWLYEGVGTVQENSTATYQAPYEPGTAYTYYKKNDMLVAVADSSNYKANLWTKFNINIKKSNGSFSFNLTDSGMSMTNGSIQMTKGVNVITLDAASGISITKNGTKNFYLDADGNIVMSGKITATSGSIGGFTITSSSLYNIKSSLNGGGDGVYIGTDGISVGEGSLVVRYLNSNGTYISTTLTGPLFRVTRQGEVKCSTLTMGITMEPIGSSCAEMLNDRYNFTNDFYGNIGIAIPIFSTKIQEFRTVVNHANVSDDHVAGCIYGLYTDNANTLALQSSRYRFYFGYSNYFLEIKELTTGLVQILVRDNKNNMGRIAIINQAASS